MWCFLVLVWVKDQQHSNHICQVYVSVRCPLSVYMCVSLQAGKVQDSVDLPDPVGGVWGAGVRLPVPLHLHRNAVLSGGC